jgi:CRISPR system Cascade subunit CasB
VSAADTDTAKERPKWIRPRGDFGDNVARTVSSLQIPLLAVKPHASAVAAMAQLRRGIGRLPGFDYRLDRYLSVPDELLEQHSPLDNEASDTEHAKHAAVTLYSLHQQSKRKPMHINGRGLGEAIADLTRKSQSPEGIRRRFAALGTASSYEETLYHLRGLILMLREKEISLDYGLLANDLRRLRHPDGRALMQAEWGREFFRGKPKSTDDETDTETDTEESMS